MVPPRRTMSMAERLGYPCRDRGNVRSLNWRRLRAYQRGYDTVMAEPGLTIVGSGPAGVAAAESFREHDADTPVRIFTADIDLPYERPPLSKEYLRGHTDDVGLHPAQWFDDRAIQLIGGAPVDRLDLVEHAVY